MPYILNIDTATEKASVCISKDEDIVAYAENPEQKEHASFINPAIGSVCKEAGIELKDLDAIAITSGPGSYTGLRVAMATAKGFCYALNKPLIMYHTLEVIAAAAVEQLQDKTGEILYCPMIDARRMEVFTALYDKDLKTIEAAGPVILTPGFLQQYLEKHHIVFFGNGSRKFSEIAENANSSFINVDFNAGNLAKLALKAFYEKKFSDVSYAEPAYLKSFFHVAK